jgi:3-dehydroquinate dehydratase / shikimate dehydrogenase
MTNSNPIRICTVVCEPRAADLKTVIGFAAIGADVIELRLDCLVDTSVAQLQELCVGLLPHVSKPLIVTLRSPEEGGQLQIDRAGRLAFWRSSIALLMAEREAFVDIEYDLLNELSAEDDFARNVIWQRVIASHHDFAGMPPMLRELYDQMAATPAGVIKIAATATDITDSLPMFELLDLAKRDGRELIPIAMGQAGLITRVLGPARGAFLTYGSFDADQTIAPGQVSVEELSSLYHLYQVTAQTEAYGLIGNPVAHSLSPHLHNAAFADKELDAVYLPLEVHDVGAFVRRMVHPRSRELDLNLRGLSVTAPHKTAVIEHLDWVDETASDVGAVNTVVVAADSLRGYNTDTAAFMAPLQEALGSVVDTSCAVVGAGGAARTVVWALRQAGARVTLFARNPVAAQALGDSLGVSWEVLDGRSFDSYEVVVNATPLGTRGKHQHQAIANADQLRGVRLVYDLVYNPIETLFLREAARAGCQRIGGLEMLIAQAGVQFKLWTGKEAPIDVMRAAAERALHSYGTS